MRTSRVCVLLGAAAAAILSMSFVSAQAADLGYGSIKDIPPPPPSGRAWYLKGTIGMKNPEPDSIRGVGGNGPGTDGFTVDHVDIKSSSLFGLGIGVEHSRWLRFDATGEYRGKQLFVAQDHYNHGGGCYDAGTGLPDGSQCGTNEYMADLESWLGLFNAYIDLGTWRGITPYVGGGIGMSYIDVQGFKDVNVHTGAVHYGNSDRSSTNFAWALYAGMSYDVTPQFTLDLGYRYTDLGSVSTGPTTAPMDPTQTTGGLEIRDIVSHDLLLSARYRLDSPEPMYPVAIK